MSSVPREGNKPPEGSTSEFFFCFFLYNYVQKIHIYTYLLNTKVTGGSAEPPLQDRGEKALNQPKPHPSGKIG